MIAGDAFPEFELPDENDEVFKSSSLAGLRYVIYFYPKDGSPGCTREAEEFNGKYAKFMMMNVPIIGVSPDTPASHIRFREKNGLKLKLLSDADHVFAKAAGAWGRKKNYGREYDGIIRSTFIVKDGIAEAVWNNVKVNGHADEVHEALKRLVRIE